MINYSVNPRPNPQNQEEAPLFHATAQIDRNLDINAFAKHIASHGCVYGRADIAAVLTLAVDCIKEQLLAGNKVTLGDLGSFFITLQSTGAKTRDEFVPAKIHGIRVKWSAGQAFKGLINEAEFQKVSTRVAQAAILGAETNNNGTVDLGSIKKKLSDKRKGLTD